MQANYIFNAHRTGSESLHRNMKNRSKYSIYFIQRLPNNHSQLNLIEYFTSFP